MRGALFIGGGAPESLRGLSALGSVDMVVSADSGLITAENWGLKSDWIVGDMDSLDSPGRLDAYQAEKVIRYPADKDYTDTELGLELLRTKGYDDITLVGGGGGRLDHLLAIHSLFDRSFYPRLWLPGAEAVYCIDAATTVEARFTVHLPLDSLVSVFPVAEGPWKLESSGLKWPLGPIEWERGSIGISNRSLDSISINALAGRFLVIVPL